MTLFPKFPAEVRNMIWTETATIPAEIEIRIIRTIEKANSTKTIKVKGELVNAEFNYHYRAIQVRNDTALLYTCKESKGILLQHKKLTHSFRLWKTGKAIQFNGDFDKVFISNISQFYLN
jgi:hypothetical protein